ncbi:putative spermidine/putrescine transport system ATP-binding protein [Conyzicola lurida]|uniref:ABC-type quaternary amine transporter n=1 Tax=Conyzicola lurida TaxID=1172621 RepID=A0A841AKY0_9MICO|nr:ABC transporter ATP-binding protein [Conyzicola lurida]MBB5842303.1 putative spermidine/putrescine transport system ATP-binding protein [Conyzicola lurida]
MTLTAPTRTMTAEPGSGATVALRNVVKTYGSMQALSGIDLELAPGEFIALLGPSGCGKTTALRALSGLETIDSGSILIDGVDVAATPTNKRDIGMVFQSYSLFPHMTVLENVEFGLRMRKVAKADRRERATEALEMVGLGAHGERFAHQLSGGQQQRVALARALVTRPRVLLLDEPLSALDAKVRVQLREEIRRITRDLGITTVFVTHDQEEALAVADRVAVMRAGRIEQIGTPEELYATPANPFVADFVGLTSRVPGEVVDGAVVVHGVRLPLLGEHQENGPVLTYIRPEDVALAAKDDPGAIPVTVVSTSFLGSLRRTHFLLPDESLIAAQHAVDEHPVVGAPAFVRLKQSAVAASPRS